jgi:hypothetical protein
MTTFHGYPIDDDQHSERPWWRLHPGVTFGSGAPYAVRTDGAVAVEAYHYDGPSITAAALTDETREAAMARVDREHPLQCPPPRCGQVWVWEQDGVPAECIVYGVVNGHALFLARPNGSDGIPALNSCLAEALMCSCCVLEITQWPMPRAVLVAGPHSPWQDTREATP